MTVCPDNSTARQIFGPHLAVLRRNYGVIRRKYFRIIGPDGLKRFEKDDDEA